MISGCLERLAPRNGLTFTATIAQLVEHIFRKDKVVGSIPTGGFFISLWLSAPCRPLLIALVVFLASGLSLPAEEKLSPERLFEIGNQLEKQGYLEAARSYYRQVQNYQELDTQFRAMVQAGLDRTSTTETAATSDARILDATADFHPFALSPRIVAPLDPEPSSSDDFPRTRLRKKWWIIGAVVLVGAAAYIHRKNRDKPPPPPGPATTSVGVEF